MSVSKIYLFSSQREAQNEFGQNKSSNNYNTLLIGPTDIFRIEGESPNTIEWNSGPEKDWYMVVVTKADVWTAGEGVGEGPD